MKKLFKKKHTTSGADLRKRFETSRGGASLKI